MLHFSLFKHSKSSISLSCVSWYLNALATSKNTHLSAIKLPCGEQSCSLSTPGAATVVFVAGRLLRVGIVMLTPIQF